MCKIGVINVKRCIKRPIFNETYKFNEKIRGTLKKSEKEMGSLFKNGHFKNVQFSKCEE